MTGVATWVAIMALNIRAKCALIAHKLRFSLVFAQVLPPR